MPAKRSPVGWDQVTWRSCCRNPGSSTVGRRTLQEYKRGGLPWLEDLDGDGRSDFVFWESFELDESQSMAAFGLVAWVYRLLPEGSLQIDWELSRHMAREIAKEYRKSPHPSGGGLPGAGGTLRRLAAEALEQFSDGRCRIPNGSITTP